MSQRESIAASRLWPRSETGFPSQILTTTSQIRELNKTMYILISPARNFSTRGFGQQGQLTYNKRRSCRQNGSGRICRYIPCAYEQNFKHRHPPVFPQSLIGSRIGADANLSSILKFPKVEQSTQHLVKPNSRNLSFRYQSKERIREFQWKQSVSTGNCLIFADILKFAGNNTMSVSGLTTPEIRQFAANKTARTLLGAPCCYVHA